MNFAFSPVGLAENYRSAIPISESTLHYALELTSGSETVGSVFETFRRGIEFSKIEFKKGETDAELEAAIDVSDSSESDSDSDSGAEKEKDADAAVEMGDAKREAWIAAARAEAERLASDPQNGATRIASEGKKKKKKKKKRQPGVVSLDAPIVKPTPREERVILAHLRDLMPEVNRLQYAWGFVPMQKVAYPQPQGRRDIIMPSVCALGTFDAFVCVSQSREVHVVCTPKSWMMQPGLQFAGNAELELEQDVWTLETRREYLPDHLSGELRSPVASIMAANEMLKRNHVAATMVADALLNPTILLERVPIPHGPLTPEQMQTQLDPLFQETRSAIAVDRGQPIDVARVNAALDEIQDAQKRWMEEIRNERENAIREARADIEAAGIGGVSRISIPRGITPSFVTLPPFMKFAGVAPIPAVTGDVWNREAAFRETCALRFGLAASSLKGSGSAGGGGSAKGGGGGGGTTATKSTLEAAVSLQTYRLIAEQINNEMAHLWRHCYHETKTFEVGVVALLSPEDYMGMKEQGYLTHEEAGKNLERVAGVKRSLHDTRETEMTSVKHAEKAKAEFATKKPVSKKKTKR